MPILSHFMKKEMYFKNGYTIILTEKSFTTYYTHLIYVLSPLLMWSRATECQKLNFTHFGNHCVRQSGLQDPTLHSFVFVYGVWFDCSMCICLILCYWQNKSKFLSVGKCIEDSSRWILLTLGKAWILDKWKLKKVGFFLSLVSLVF